MIDKLPYAVVVGDRMEEPGAPLMDPADLARRVVAKRRADGLTLREAAAEIGVSVPTLSRVERGDHSPDRENLLRLARWVGLRIDPMVHPRQSRNTLVHGQTASTLEAVELHLRADRNLADADAEVLTELFKIAYERLATRPARKPRR